MSAPSLPLHTLQKQFLEGLTRFALEFFQDVEKVVTIYQGEMLRYQEENRGLRSLLNDVIHPEMKVHTKDGNRSTTTVREQAPEQTTPEFAEPLAKMAKTEPTEQSRFDSSESLAAKHGPKDVLQPSIHVPKEEQTEISVSSELLTDRLPGIPSVVHMEVSKPYTLADTPHGSETHILQPLGVTKGQQIEYDRHLAPEGESRSDNGLTVECFKSEDDEDTGRLDITTSLQDMAFGNFHTATECPGLSSWEDIFNKDLGSLEPPKTSYKKTPRGGRPSGTSPPLKRRTLSYPPPEIKFGPGGHWPRLTEAKHANRCHDAACTRKTKYICMQCYVALCPGCFANFHTI